MTPDEARTKWCPFARPIYVSPLNANCLANDCMAWRWHLSPARIAEAKARLYAGKPEHPHELEPDGYCGLAGHHGET